MKDLQQIDLNDSQWNHYKTVEPFNFEDKWVIPSLRGDFFRRELADGTELSFGHFTFKVLFIEFFSKKTKLFNNFLKH